MISRIWFGWTTPVNADAYERLLRAEIFPGIMARNIPGFLNIQLLRRDAGDETEFATIMTFESLDAVIAFAGPNYEEGSCQSKPAPCCRASTRHLAISTSSTRDRPDRVHQLLDGVSHVQT